MLCCAVCLAEADGGAYDSESHKVDAPPSTAANSTPQMTEREARRLLGVGPSAGLSAVKQAYRRAVSERASDASALCALLCNATHGNAMHGTVQRSVY